MFLSVIKLNTRSVTNCSLNGTKNGPKNEMYIDDNITSPNKNCFFSSNSTALCAHRFCSPLNFDVNFCARVNFFWLSCICVCSCSCSRLILLYFSVSCSSLS